jgi:hypothetical protein
MERGKLSSTKQEDGATNASNYSCGLPEDSLGQIQCL